MYFDETTTAQVKKQMDLTLCYWSPTHNEVVITFYTLFFGHAEADKVVSRMIEQFKEQGLYFKGREESTRIFRSSR